MVTIDLEEVLARSRTIATQMGMDANASPTIDNKGGLRALLNHVVQNLYRQKAVDPRFLRDITVRHTIAMTANVGAVPDEILRELLITGDFQDTAGSLITYYNFPVDYSSSSNYDQLGYVIIQGNSFLYTAPAPTTSYTGNLFVTTPSTPTIGTTIDFPSEATANDVVLELSRAIRGEVQFDIVDRLAA